MKGDREIEALVTALDGDEEFQLDLGVLVGKFRRRQDQAIRDMEAARLLPLGAGIAAIRQHCHRSTVYRRVSRAMKVARLKPDATKA
jgi:hypothetical protein